MISNLHCLCFRANATISLAHQMKKYNGADSIEVEQVAKEKSLYSFSKLLDSAIVVIDCHACWPMEQLLDGRESTKDNYFQVLIQVPLKRHATHWHDDSDAYANAERSGFGWKA